MFHRLREAGVSFICAVLLLSGVAVAVWLRIPWGYCLLAPLLLLLTGVASIAFAAWASARNPVPRSWRQERKTIAELEAQSMVQHEKLGPDPVAFGLQRGAWIHLLAQMQDGDELWTFSSPPRFWELLAGRAGVVLVRRGKTVGHIVTELN